MKTTTTTQHRASIYPTKWKLSAALFLLLFTFQNVAAFGLGSNTNGRKGLVDHNIGGHRQPQQKLQAAKMPPSRRHDDNDLKHSSSCSDSNRRQSLTSAMTAAVATAVFGMPRPSRAGLFAQEPRRQLELCIVSLLRVMYWAENASIDLQQSDNPDLRKQRYLEVRLASKAMVTGKVGGGANLNVFNLNSLQLKGCLSDLVGYAGDSSIGDRRKAEDLQTDILESLASNVEFDGLETTIDPSPRSSLTMAMYTKEKAVFVRRTLSERIIPTSRAMIRIFPDVTSACEAYVQQTYSDELPARLRQKQPTATAG